MVFAVLEVFETTKDAQVWIVDTGKVDPTNSIHVAYKDALNKAAQDEMNILETPYTISCDYEDLKDLTVELPQMITYSVTLVGP